jgi:hypothetical protein
MATLCVTPQMMRAMFLRAQQVSQQETPEAKKTLNKIRSWFLQVASGRRVAALDTDQLFKSMVKDRAAHVMQAIDFVGADPGRISMAYFRRRRHDPMTQKTTPLDDAIEGAVQRQDLLARHALDDAIEGDVQRQDLLARHALDEKVRLGHVEDGMADARNGKR